MGPSASKGNLPSTIRKEIGLTWGDASKLVCADARILKINLFVMALIARLDSSLKSRPGRSLLKPKKSDIKRNQKSTVYSP